MLLELSRITCLYTCDRTFMWPTPDFVVKAFWNAGNQ